MKDTNKKDDDNIIQESGTHFHTGEHGEIYYHSHDNEHIESGDTEHVHEDGTVHSHGHGSHGHKHSHENTKAVINRLSRAIGHMEAIKRMVQDGRDCAEVLIQLSAVRSAINNTGKVILKDHIEHCIVDAIETNDQETIDELYKAIDKFVK